MPVQGIVVRGFLQGIFRYQVNHQLMAEEVEIHPVITGPTFPSAKVIPGRLVKPIKWPEKVSGL